MNNSSLAATSSAGGLVILYASSACGFVGLVFNTLVIAFICRPNVIPGKVPFFFLMNEAVSEWLICFIRSFSWLTDVEWSVADNGWGTFVCKMMYSKFISFSILHANTSLLIVFTVERYISVAHPMLHKKFIPPLNVFLVFLCWATGAVRAINRCLEPQRRGTSCVIVPIDVERFEVFAPIVIVWSVIVTIIINAALNGRIVWILKRGTTISSGNTLRKRQLQRDLTHSVVITTVGFALMAGPLSTVYLLMNFGAMPKDFRGLLYQSLTYLQSFFYILNPLVYLCCMRAMRQQVFALLRCIPIRSAMPEKSPSRGVELFSISNEPHR